MMYQQFLLFMVDAKENSLQWKCAGVSIWITPRPRPPHPPGPFIWWRVMVGPGQHRAGECCLTEDNYQLCIITCVAGHRGQARAGNWELRRLLKHDHERAIWWMSWRIQQVYNKNTICVKISTTKIDHLCMYNLPSTIHHSPSSSPDCAGLAAG